MKKSSLLINEPPLQVLPSLAKAIGLNEAIVTQQLHYWLENPKAGITRFGHRWIYNTYDEWLENFPFWSIPTIQRTFASLEKKGVIISAQLEKRNRDMRKFYRIDYDQLEKMEYINLIRSTISNRYDVKGNTETTTKTNSESAKRKILMPKGLKKLEYEVENMLYENGYRGKTSKTTLAREIVKLIADDLMEEKQDKTPMKNAQWNMAYGFPSELDLLVEKLERGLGINNMMRDERAVEVYRWIEKQTGLDKFIQWATHKDRVQFVGKYRNNPSAIKNEWKLAFANSIADERTSMLEMLDDD